MGLTAPNPTVKGARQFFDGGGKEIFYAEAHGRRPDVPDALRVMGRGKTRQEAEENARTYWQAAWRALHPALRATDPK